MLEACSGLKPRFHRHFSILLTMHANHSAKEIFATRLNRWRPRKVGINDSEPVGFWSILLRTLPNPDDTVTMKLPKHRGWHLYQVHPRSKKPRNMQKTKTCDITTIQEILSYIQHYVSTLRAGVHILFCHSMPVRLFLLISLLLDRSYIRTTSIALLFSVSFPKLCEVWRKCAARSHARLVIKNRRQRSLSEYFT